MGHAVVNWSHNYIMKSKNKHYKKNWQAQRRETKTHVYIGGRQSKQVTLYVNEHLGCCVCVYLLAKCPPTKCCVWIPPKPTTMILQCCQRIILGCSWRICSKTTMTPHRPPPSRLCSTSRELNVPKVVKFLKSYSFFCNKIVCFCFSGSDNSLNTTTSNKMSMNVKFASAVEVYRLYDHLMVAKYNC